MPTLKSGTIGKGHNRPTGIPGLIPFAIAFFLFLTANVQSQETVANALYLNQGYVELPSTLTVGLTDATVEAWVKWENFNKWSRVFDFGREGNAAVLQNEKKSSKLHFAVYNRAGKRHRITAKNSVRKDIWYHIAAVSGSKTGIKLYINGARVEGDPFIRKYEKFDDGIHDPEYKWVSDTLATATFDDISGGMNYIGKSNWPKDELFHGYISEFRIWNTVRTRDQIKNTMVTQLAGDEAGLVGYWRFDRAEGNSVKDLTGNRHNATLVAGAGISSVKGPSLKKVKTAGEARQETWATFHQEGRRAFEAGDWKTAIESLSKVESAYKDFQGVQSMLTDYHKKRAELWEGYYRQGKQALQRGEWEEAKATLSKIDPAYKNYKVAQSMIKGASAGLQQKQRHRQFYERGRQAFENGDYDSAVTLLSKVGKGTDRYKDAQSIIAKAKSQKTNEANQPLYVQGKQAFKNGDYQGAVESLLKVGKEFENYPDAQSTAAEAKRILQVELQKYSGTWESKETGEGIWWKLVIHPDGAWEIYNTLNPESKAAKMFGGGFSWGEVDKKGRFRVTRAGLNLYQKQQENERLMYRCTLSENALHATYYTGDPKIKFTK